MKKDMTMRETLDCFMAVWNNIIATGEYDSIIEELTIGLTSFKELDLRSQEDMQYFEFAQIFMKYLQYIRPDRHVKKALETVSNVHK